MIIVDASTSGAIADLHPFWLTNGAHVVTANKRAISSSIALYNSVYAAVRNHNRMYMSEVRFRGCRHAHPLRSAPYLLMAAYVSHVCNAH